MRCKSTIKANRPHIKKWDEVRWVAARQRGVVCFVQPTTGQVSSILLVERTDITYFIIQNFFTCEQIFRQHSGSFTFEQICSVCLILIDCAFGLGYIVCHVMVLFVLSVHVFVFSLEANAPSNQ